MTQFRDRLLGFNFRLKPNCRMNWICASLRRPVKLLFLGLRFPLGFGGPDRRALRPSAGIPSRGRRLLPMSRRTRRSRS
jgi:hypothetical protein